MTPVNTISADTALSRSRPPICGVLCTDRGSNCGGYSNVIDSERKHESSAGMLALSFLLTLY